MESFRHIGLTLRLLRELRGKSQGQIAKEAGISKSQLSKYENGRLPKLETLDRLLASLGVHYYQFFYTLNLIDNRSVRLNRPPTPADLDPDRLLAELHEEQGSLLPTLVTNQARPEPLEQAFKRCFENLLVAYRLTFEQTLVSASGSARSES
jgi:transcriptional regulator with XRE-family HTH domain